MKNIVDPRFIIEIIDPETRCIDEEILIVPKTLTELGEIFGEDPTDLVRGAVYELNEKEVDRLAEFYSLRIINRTSFYRFRLERIIDKLPYKIHTNRELSMMLSGIKPFAAFCSEYPHNYEGLIPESLFLPYVNVARFIKHEFILLNEISPGSSAQAQGVRWVLYALPEQVWRIEAFVLLQRCAAKAGWSEGFERMEGSLLGYEDWQNDIYIDNIYKKNVRQAQTVFEGKDIVWCRAGRRCVRQPTSRITV